jgi:single-stranded DNA-binding protein
MNHCTLLAELISDPQLRYTQDNQTPISEVMVTFPGLREDDAPQQMKVVGWGNLAQEMQERYRTGDRVLLEGRLAMNTVDRPEGFREKRAEMTAQRIYSVSALGAAGLIGTPATPVEPPPAYSAPAVAAPTSPPPPSAAPAPATPEPEVDYDDIPF